MRIYKVIYYIFVSYQILIDKDWMIFIKNLIEKQLRIDSKTYQTIKPYKKS